ncbi:DUF1473 family protein [Borreliella andersonii]|uniref:DUF1473 family protein n=1 Tax=Borrelia andersonii TaxID=42109 RepID=UPI00292D3ED1|nr:DUF1473 family protein [Borreliella andersonii]WNY70056.1 DUF1473 family protein [Borreliella andersonii]
MVESFQDRNGDCIKYDYIDERWSYDFLITNSKPLDLNQEDLLETGFESLQEGGNE